MGLCTFNTCHQYILHMYKVVLMLDFPLSLCCAGATDILSFLSASLPHQFPGYLQERLPQRQHQRTVSKPLPITHWLAARLVCFPGSPTIDHSNGGSRKFSWHI